MVLSSLRQYFILKAFHPPAGWNWVFLMKRTWQSLCPCESEDVIYGVEEAWYFTNAMAASSLQNSSNTITPSSNVMWSITGPSGSKPSNRLLTNRSLGVKSWMRWIRTISSPTTLTITEKSDRQPEARLTYGSRRYSCVCGWGKRDSLDNTEVTCKFTS